MILTIKTDKPDAEISLISDDAQQIDFDTWLGHRDLSVTIISKIENLLKKNDKTNKDISKIIVFAGPGSYTGLRIGITVANALAYSLSIPVIGGQGDDWIKNSVDTSSDGFVSPEYGGEAHITTPRK